MPTLVNVWYRLQLIVKKNINTTSRHYKPYSQGKWPEVQPAESHVTPPHSRHHLHHLSPSVLCNPGVRVTTVGGFIYVIWRSGETFCTGPNWYVLSFMFMHFLLTHICGRKLHTFMYNEESWNNTGHWYYSVNGQKNTEKGKGKAQKPKQREALNSGNCVPSPLHYSRRVCFVVGFVLISVSGFALCRLHKQEKRDSLRRKKKKKKNGQTGSLRGDWVEIILGITEEKKNMLTFGDAE